MTIQASNDQSDPGLKFKKEMETRHIVMLALGGVIGTGLFLTSGYTVNQAGPLGAVIAYIIGAVMVYLVMVCLGELAVQMPETGSFSSYATRYLGPARATRWRGCTGSRGPSPLAQSSRQPES